jgi:hypothetical protein
MDDHLLLINLRALQGQVQAMSVLIANLMENLSPSRSPRVGEQATDDPATCLHPFLVPDMPSNHKMCQTCGAQKSGEGPWQP